MAKPGKLGSRLAMFENMNKKHESKPTIKPKAKRKKNTMVNMWENKLNTKIQPSSSLTIVSPKKVKKLTTWIPINDAIKTNNTMKQIPNKISHNFNLQNVETTAPKLANAPKKTYKKWNPVSNIQPKPSSNTPQTVNKLALNNEFVHKLNNIIEGKDEVIKPLDEEYISVLSKVEPFGIYASIDGLSDRSTFISHKDDKADPQSDNLRKIMKEIHKQLPQNIITGIDGSMFIRFDENNPRFLQILLTGLDDTPYANGLFLFDIYLGNDYPNKPLMIKHISNGATLCHANNGPGGFSPNLHQITGKVCLSLLGTWSGPGWDAGKSNVYQVMSTIMLMILGAEHPYYMEPSFGGWEGTVIGRTKHQRKVIEYDEEVMYHNVKYTILETLKKPYVGFEDVIKLYFKIKSDWIIKVIERWIDNENYTKSFKLKMQPLLKEVKEEFQKLNNWTPECSNNVNV